MFTGPSLQVISDCIQIALDNGYKNSDEAQDIFDFCDTNIKAVCSICGGTGEDPETQFDPPCNDCRGTGMGPSFNALANELGQRNVKIQDKVKKKLREKKNGKN